MLMCWFVYCCWIRSGGKECLRALCSDLGVKILNGSGGFQGFLLFSRIRVGRKRKWEAVLRKRYRSREGWSERDERLEGEWEVRSFFCWWILLVSQVRSIVPSPQRLFFHFPKLHTFRTLPRSLSLFSTHKHCFSQRVAPFFQHLSVHSRLSVEGAYARGRERDTWSFGFFGMDPWL